MSGALTITRETIGHEPTVDLLMKLNECLLGLGPDAHDNMQRLVAQCGELLGATYAYYVQLDDGVWNALAQWHLPEDYCWPAQVDGSLAADVLVQGGGDIFAVRNLPATSYAGIDPNIARYRLLTFVGHDVKCGDDCGSVLCLLYDRPYLPDQENAQVMGILAAALGVEEQRWKAEQRHQQMEMQLRGAQKLESVGQLAAGIAHEINTPTQFVGDNLQFMKDAFSDLIALLNAYDDLLQASKAGAIPADVIQAVEDAADQADVEYLKQDIPRALEQSLDGIQRVTKIVRAMKEFSHPDTGEKVAVDINKAIESTITVARNEWKYVADMQTELDPSLSMVTCLPGDLNQVILNLIVNAAHAIGDVVGDGANGKGTITVTTRQDGDWAELRISDTGTGIPEKARGKIFDPFFTTKEVGKGTGQGLAIAYNVVVKKHEGTIAFETELGRGTTFIIRLPNPN